VFIKSKTQLFFIYSLIYLLSFLLLLGFNKAGKKGYDKYLEELVQLIKDKSYSKSFKNFRIYDNVHIPKAMLKQLRDAADPPLVIDFFAPNKNTDFG
jgi:hypothetical protein